MVPILLLISFSPAFARFCAKDVSRVSETISTARYVSCVIGFWLLGAQTTAMCVVYGHYIDGSLQRFLSSGEDRWFEIHGQPEPWESELFSKEFEWNYLLGEESCSPLHDGLFSDIAAYYGLPEISDSRSVWQIDRGVMDENKKG